MNNLHRELAPISDAAWAKIEDEATRTLKRTSPAGVWSTSKAPGGSAFRRSARATSRQSPLPAKAS